MEALQFVLTRIVSYYNIRKSLKMCACWFWTPVLQNNKYDSTTLGVHTWHMLPHSLNFSLISENENTFMHKFLFFHHKLFTHKKLAAESFSNTYHCLREKKKGLSTKQYFLGVLQNFATSIFIFISCFQKVILFSSHEMALQFHPAWIWKVACITGFLKAALNA